MDDFNTQIMHYREQMEKQKKTSAQVISTEMDTMKKHLEDQARGLERREQAELLRKVKEMVESVSKQAESLQKSFLTINDGLDTRFTLFEEYVQARLDAITAQVRGNMHIDKLEQGVYALRQDVLEIQQNMTLGDAKRIVSRLSCLDDATAAALPSLVAGWGNGQFPSQEALVAFIEAKLDGINTDSTTMASLAALGELQTTMGSKMSSLEDKMSTCDGMLQFVMRQQPGANGAAAASSSSLKIDDLRANIEDRIEQAIAKLHSEQRVISHDQMAMNQRLLSAQADSKQLQEEFKRDLEQLTLASKAGVQMEQADSEQQLNRDLKLFPLASVAGTRGRQPEDLDEKSMLDGGSDETSMRLGGRPSSEDFGLEASQRRQPEDLDEKSMLDGGSDETPMRLGGGPSSEDFGLEASQREFLAVVAQHGDELAKICSRLDDLESCNQSHICDEEHVSALEEGLQYLSERIVAIEKTQAST